MTVSLMYQFSSKAYTKKFLDLTIYVYQIQIRHGDWTDFLGIIFLGLDFVGIIDTDTEDVGDHK